LIVKLWKSSGAKKEELGPICWLIAESAGHLPVQASAERNESYDEAWRWFVASPPDLTNALQGAMRSLEEAFTADAANLVGRIFMLQGKNGLAVPFLEEARFLEPRHPYAQGNLALALYALGEKQIATRIAVQACDSSRTPDSLKKNLQNLVTR
jgi:tetratricopeptide (TPR) repeat protein